MYRVITLAVNILHCAYYTRWGAGCALVESVPFVRRVMGSIPALAIGTLGKSVTYSCLCRFSVKFRHSFRAVSGAPLSSSLVDLKRRHRNSLNE